MQFTFTDEQEQLRSTVQRFLADKSPTTEVRRLMDTESGYDPNVWAQLTSELGLAGVHVPEAYGGVGLSFAELGIVLEEMGRSLLCAPFFSSSVLATTAILELGSEEQKSQLLPRLVSGERLGTVAFTEANGRWDANGISLSSDSDRLTGEKHFVIDGLTADLIVVAARSETGLRFYTVDGNASGLTRRSLETTDPTRKQASIVLDNVDAEPLGDHADGDAAYARLLDLSAVALANEMVGGAQKMLDSAVEYASMRMQFGRAVGSFQAIKHKCSDMLLEVELAKSAAYYAAQAAADDDPELPALASLAKAAASEAFMNAARDCIQIHGGIGFTWDNDTHLWFKRAKSSEVYLGDPAYHRELLVQRWEG